MLRMAFILNVYGSFVFCHCLFLSFCLFISISLVDKGGTEAQGCVTTVSWHGVWSWVIVAGLQSVRGISSLCYPRAGNQAWAAVSQHIPPRSPVLLWGKFPCDLCHSLLYRKKNHTEYRSLAHPRVIDLWLRAKRLPDWKNDKILYFIQSLNAHLSVITIIKNRKSQWSLPKGVQSKNTDVLIVFYQFLQLLICQLASLHDRAWVSSSV